MIERIPDLPDHVVGLVAHGDITAEDYREVLEPALEADYAEGRKPHVLFVLDEDFTGFRADALWEDMRFGIRHLTGWRASPSSATSTGSPTCPSWSRRSSAVT